MDNRKRYNRYKARYRELKEKLNGIIQDLEIVKELGRGVHGVVYLAVDTKNIKYAIKVEKMMHRDVRKSLSSPYWREIEFAETMNKLFPDHFLKLINYEIKQDCTFDHMTPELMEKIKSKPTHKQQYYEKLFASPFCSVKVWSLIDLTLQELLNSWGDEFKSDVFYNLFIQVVYVIYLLTKYGYFHRDFDSKNIGLLKTDNKTIRILNYEIPTQGYHIKPIDYGSVLNWKYELRTFERELLQNQNDLMVLFRYVLINFDKFNQLNGISEYDHNDVEIIIPDDTRTLLDKHLINLQINDKEKEICRHTLYKILYYEDYERQLMGENLRQLYPPLLRIPEEHIIYIVSNYKDVLKVLQYLIDNR